METHWIKRGSRELLVVALGWAAVGGIRTYDTESDVVELWDYRDLALPSGFFDGYDHFQLIAWSFGVWVSERIFSNVAWTEATAVNGTPRPVDGLYGIDRRAFDLTLRSIRRLGRSAFEDRMCCSIDSVARNDRSQEETTLELELMAERFVDDYPEQQIAWSCAVVGGRDLIFPPDNQLRYWRKHGVTIDFRPEMGHFFE